MIYLEVNPTYGNQGGALVKDGMSNVSDAKSYVDELRLVKEIRKLAVLRHPLF